MQKNPFRFFSLSFVSNGFHAFAFLLLLSFLGFSSFHLDFSNGRNVGHILGIEFFGCFLKFWTKFNCHGCFYYGHRRIIDTLSEVVAQIMVSYTSKKKKKVKKKNFFFFNRYGANVLTLPHWSQLSMETKHICEQFRNHHLELCKKEIAKDRR